MRCAASKNLLSASLVMLAVGCQQDSHKGELADFKEVFPRQTPPPVEHSKTVLVAEGTSPVVFQVREPSHVHVLDLTTGQEIASASVGRGELIYVSEDSGAFAGKRQLMPGPFEPGHKYGISIDAGGTESWQTKQVDPNPHPSLLPATQPQQSGAPR